MNLDRQLQRQILEYLKEFYVSELADINKQEFFKHPEYEANAKYLYEHKLIDGAVSKTNIKLFALHIPRITKDGLDFLEDDGGISAILKTVTIKLDVENIRTLLEDKIISSTLPETERKTLIEK